MKRRAIPKKIVFLSNVLTSALIVLSILLYYWPSQLLLPIKILNLFFPIVILAHVVSLVFLAFQHRRFFLFSLLLLVSSYFVFGTFYKLNLFGSSDTKEDTLSILTYNVRGFSEYAWMKKNDVGDKIINFTKSEAPDIICLQEHSRIRFKDLREYPYRSETPYVDYKTVQAIFSKYPIISNGSLDLPNTLNNIIFADIVYKNDTIRIYNVHLQSYNIVPSKETFSENESEKNFKKVIRTFKKQIEQAKIFREHTASSPYKTIICGDFNNTQFSSVYRLIKGEMTDTFLEKGSGFGSTYDLKGYPMRIDYILADDSFEVNSHQNFDIKLSDHYPVSATLRLRSKQ